ncbi:hypothetical protein OROMI_027513 [Orobanche minor]
MLLKLIFVVARWVQSSGAAFRRTENEFGTYDSKLFLY